MSEESGGQSQGIGICGILTIIFVVLKVAGNFEHSWWWVVSPLWIPVGLVVGVGVVILAAAGITLICEGIYRWVTK